VAAPTPPNGYRLRVGSPLDRALLLSFARRAYREIDPDRTGDRLPHTIERYLSGRTPLWWLEVELKSEPDAEPDVSRTATAPRSGLPHRSASAPTGRFQSIACLWLGNATTPNSAEAQAYVLLIYVAPEHRRRGLATYLLTLAEAEARQRGDRQLGLQVQADNAAAIALYEKLGYATLSRWMGKPLS